MYWSLGVSPTATTGDPNLLYLVLVHCAGSEFSVWTIYYVAQTCEPEVDNVTACGFQL